MKRFFIIICCTILCGCNKNNEGSQGENFTSKVNQVSTQIIDDSAQLTFFNNPRTPIQPAFDQFPTGSVKPKGWILELMKSDIENGIVGALDELYPGISSDDLYRTARRGGMEDIPEMGDLVLTGAAWEKSIMWWNAETIGNWWDGFIRHAFLVEDEKAIQQSHDIIRNLMASQDDDGYIGIYKSKLRYKHTGSNGELWAQTTAFRTLLGYYELTKDKLVLDAVEKGMKLTMDNYGENSTNPFNLQNAFGGVTHGLMLTDVCETLYRITRNQDYQDYAIYLYKAFSTYSINRSFNDLRYPYLKEIDSLYEGHAVHTYEHIRTMANAYFNTGYPELEQAYNHMLQKLKPCILPSGAGHGNEWIAKLDAHPDYTGAEYCAMLELRNSYGSLLQKTGDIAFADDAEKLTYNAMMGARNKNGTAITYGKMDNCYILDGNHYENGHSREDSRYKYSPTHSEPAVCCVPNYGRNFTYFLDQMWMKKDNGIVATMFGPSEIKVKLNGETVIIEQITKYPLSDQVTFKFKMNKPVIFDLYIRKPSWSNKVVSSIDLGDTEEGYYKVSNEWKDGDAFTISFDNDTKIHNASNEELYVQRGPIVFAYEIPHEEKIIKEYENGFSDFYCLPFNSNHKNLEISKYTEFRLKSGEETEGFYDREWYLEGKFYDSEKQNQNNINLIPMGKTVLRRVTFPQHN